MSVSALQADFLHLTEKLAGTLPAADFGMSAIQPQQVDERTGIPTLRTGEEEMNATATVTHTVADGATSSGGVLRLTNKNLIWSAAIPHEAASPGGAIAIPLHCIAAAETDGVVRVCTCMFVCVSLSLSPSISLCVYVCPS